ncbi:transmembrane protein 26-like [Mya arenaria]|uniref:transmembrane protein 26-like n=1 Tax=Mya arenaria TaxID=6604 RepID=UPI0022E8D6A4|nr:transmembrane protein 26-like [Mya arenaria]XP_052791032.1 transmembrane protein 26-like [Mya arenaria]
MRSKSHNGKYRHTEGVNGVRKNGDQENGGQCQGTGDKWFQLILLRLFMITHNVLATWRLVISTGNSRFWVLSFFVIFIVIDGFYQGKNECFTEELNKNKTESFCSYKKMRPVVAAYLLCILPVIWVLQLHEYVLAISSLDEITTTVTTTTVAGATSASTTTGASTTAGFLTSLEGTILSIQNQTWIVVMQETMIYVLVVARAIEERGLSDKLLELLGAAADTMELFALFDEDEIVTSLPTTIIILTVWTISLIQFIPKLQDSQEYISTMCLQDGPFLVLRVSITVGLQFISYSLTFFVIKNVVVLVLMTYKLSNEKKDKRKVNVGK